MDSSILLILLQDGVTSGAVYALLALSLVLVFTVTRVIFIPQGELVAFGALTYAALDAGSLPGSLWLLCGLGAAAFLTGLRHGAPLRLALETLLLPAAVTAATLAATPLHPGMTGNAALAVLIVAPMAPYLYRLAFQPLAEASVLVLLIAAVGVHLAMVGLGLVFFGAEGYRANGFSDASFILGDLIIPGQALWIVGMAALVMAALFGFFGFTLMGRALRATAVNRLGARLVGIATAQSGLVAFSFAGVIGAVSGILIVPLTTMYFDSGFVIGLKGFTAAIIGGMASYPGAVLAAIGVGLIESFSSFWASAFKEVIVFTAIIPVLLIRTLMGRHGEDEE
jgi:branched-chain amino acid transport system permease protein